ncbi:MAG: calcium/sodium antiporter [Chryseolinea sp.]
MYLELCLLLVGFGLLIKGAYFLVQGASSIAKTFNISTVAIGLTVVAFGTSTPELIVSLYASFKGRDELAFANIIGSNIFNILFVLGLAGLIHPLIIQRNTIRFEIPLSLMAATILYILVNDQILWGRADLLGRWDALILLATFSLFMMYLYRALKSTADYDESHIKVQSPAVATGNILLGLALLTGGSIIVVDNAIILSGHFALPQRFVGVTFLAVGTSLPELTTAIMAAYRKNTDMAFGNVIGSNIFNIFFTLGATGLVHPMKYNEILNSDIEILGLATLLLVVFMFVIQRRKLHRWEAFILFGGYFAYIIYNFRESFNALV